MKKLVTFALLALIAIGGGVLVVKNITPSSQTPADSATTPAGLTLSVGEVAKHNSAQSCWLIINNKVYDVTSSMSQHPGGAEAILANCGKESTEAFNTKGKPDGKPHSATAQSFLEQLYIGDLNQTVNINPTSAASNPSDQTNSVQQNRYRGGDDDEVDD